MILGEDVLLRLVKQERIVKGLSERELKKPERAGFDLRLGSIFRLKPSQKVFVTDFDESVERFFDLKAREQVSCMTVEELKVPAYLLALLYPKPELFELGLSVSVTNAGPGFKGFVKFLLVNNNRNPVRVQLGAPVLRVSFLEVKTGVKQYKRPKQ
jgi:deoxycytidine triphosphate deaminase